MPRKKAATLEPETQSTQETMPIEQLVTPAEYEAITSANIQGTLPRLVLRLFLHVNYLWHISRMQQGKTEMPPINWENVEAMTKATIEASLANLLSGIDPSSWTDDEDNKSAYLAWKCERKANVLKLR